MALTREEKLARRAEAQRQLRARETPEQYAARLEQNRIRIAQIRRRNQEANQAHSADRNIGMNEVPESREVPEDIWSPTVRENELTDSTQDHSVTTASNDQNVLSDEELDRIDENLLFCIPNEENLKKVYNNMRNAMGHEGMGESVCLVCDQFCSNKDIAKYQLHELPLENMRNRLKPGFDICPKLKEQYNVSAFNPIFCGMCKSIEKN